MNWQLCDGVYLLQKPEGPPDIEITFIHGLERNGSADAYRKTWLVRDSEDECWPATWLKNDHPKARVLSLSYDASVVQTATTGRMDLYAIGESLLRQMCDLGGIGQNNCPVVFVCHCFGGLVAKQIAVIAHQKSRSDEKSERLLHNTKGFFFYGTPHVGSEALAKEFENYATYLYRQSPLKDGLVMINDEVGRLNEGFAAAEGNHKWAFFVVTGANETVVSDFNTLCLSLMSILDINDISARNGQDCFAIFLPMLLRSGRAIEVENVGNVAPCYSAQPFFTSMFCFLLLQKRSSFGSTKIVEETSARVVGHAFLQVGADHLNICKPASTTDSSFRALLDFLSQIIKSQARVLPSLPNGFLPISYNQETLTEKLAKAPIVGVVGMGGIGKSTLCKNVYNLQCGSYDKSSFLSDIKDSKLTKVQKRLYEDLIGGKLHDLKEEHLKEIRDCIRTRKVLVVYDDVWSDQEKCDALQIQAFIEGSGKSRAILASRNCQVLQKYTDIMMDVKFLDKEASMKLFDYHAFQKLAHDNTHAKRSYFDERGDDELKNIREAIVTGCNGLPLSLEVIGSYLGVEKEVELQSWKEAKENLEQAESFTGGSDNDRLWSRLKPSYDVLGEKERKMFLDIANFHSVFGGFGTSNGMSVFHTCAMYSHGRKTLQNLVDRCLVRYDSLTTRDNQNPDPLDLKFGMHDQLRDLGRKIVRDNLGEFGMEQARYLQISENEDEDSASSIGIEVKTFMEAKVCNTSSVIE
jgi:GTPase SAR1 family protein